MVFPWIPFLQESGDMGDLEYIEGKVLNSDYFQVTGAIDAVNDTIEYVPATGKTAFLIEAKIVTSVSTVPIGGNASNIGMIKAALKINTVTKDTTIHGFSFGGGIIASGSGVGGAGGAYSYDDGRFNVKGLSLVGNSSKKIEIENILDSTGSAVATMSGYLVDT